MTTNCTRIVAAVMVSASTTSLGCRPQSDVAPDSATTESSRGVISTRERFAGQIAGLMLDDQALEFEATVMLKIVNPNRDDESPLADAEIEHPDNPGPHTMDGKLYAEIGALRKVLGESKPVSIVGERVLIGSPEVLIVGHRHGDALYVPVKLFARQFGSYVDIGCSIANCAMIWTPDILAHMRKLGYRHSAGMVEGLAEGLVKPYDVRTPPAG